jgi:hypothetical protein
MWARRTARRMGWTRNPLRRTSDRLEAWLTFLLIMILLLIAPWAGWWAGRERYRDDIRANDWERQHRFAVTAELLEDGSRSVGRAPDDVPAPRSVLTPARWTGPDGAVHAGRIFAGPVRKAGSTVQIWVDEHGKPATRPMHRNPILDAMVAALLLVAGLVAGLSGLRRIAISRLDRRRLRAWQAEWLIVGPRWSHR